MALAQKGRFGLAFQVNQHRRKPLIAQPLTHCVVLGLLAVQCPVGYPLGDKAAATRPLYQGFDVGRCGLQTVFVTTGQGSHDQTSLRLSPSLEELA